MKTGHLPTVMPAQAGIQISAFRKYFKAAATLHFQIPARAGMTALDIRIYGTSCPPLLPGIFHIPDFRRKSEKQIKPLSLNIFRRPPHSHQPQVV